MKTPSTGATARVRIRIIGRCRATPRGAAFPVLEAVEYGPRLGEFARDYRDMADFKRNKPANVEDAASQVSLTNLQSLAKPILGSDGIASLHLFYVG
jgi:hypothetical protein